jgi:hypothetical protein
MKRKRPAEAGQGSWCKSILGDRQGNRRLPSMFPVIWAVHPIGCATIHFTSSRLSPFAILIFKTISTALNELAVFHQWLRNTADQTTSFVNSSGGRAEVIHVIESVVGCRFNRTAQLKSFGRTSTLSKR